MNSNCFAGLTDKQIHQVLLDETRSKQIIITMPDGSTRFKTVTDDFRAYGMRKMALYVQDVIVHLQTDYNITVKDPSMYAGYNKMVLRMKEIGKIEPNADITRPKPNDGW